MLRAPDNQCRRCGRELEQVWQWVDPADQWAVCAVECACGHAWTVIHSAPENLGPLRGWMAGGCQPPEGPIGLRSQAPWRAHRIEGIGPNRLFAAS